MTGRTTDGRWEKGEVGRQEAQSVECRPHGSAVSSASRHASQERPLSRNKVHIYIHTLYSAGNGSKERDKDEKKRKKEKQNFQGARHSRRRRGPRERHLLAPSTPHPSQTPHLASRIPSSPSLRRAPISAPPFPFLFLPPPRSSPPFRPPPPSTACPATTLKTSTATSTATSTPPPSQNQHRQRQRQRSRPIRAPERLALSYPPPPPPPHRPPSHPTPPRSTPGYQPCPREATASRPNSPPQSTTPPSQTMQAPTARSASDPRKCPTKVRFHSLFLGGVCVSRIARRPRGDCGWIGPLLHASRGLLAAVGEELMAVKRDILD